MSESVEALQKGAAGERQEAGMLILSCLMCLRALPIGRATLWDFRKSIGKPFDTLHRWCDKEKSALAAELRAPTNALCKRWKKQPKPATQEKDPKKRSVRMKVVDILNQGLLGVTGNSPASPAPLSMASPGMPTPVQAAELEAALFARFLAAEEKEKDKEKNNKMWGDYKHAARTLRSNLALSGNSELRSRILAGEMDVADIAMMDSAALAPESLQKERAESQRKAMEETIITELKVTAKDDEGGYSATAPPPMITATKFLKGVSSTDLAKRSGSFVSLENSTENRGQAGDASSVPIRPLEPPPTPFRLGVNSPARGGRDEEDQIDVLATPGQEDEDEEVNSIIRYLSQPV